MVSKSSLYRKQKRERGLCLHCTSPAVEGKSYCVVHRAKTIAHKRKRAALIQQTVGRHPNTILAQKYKRIVMEHYGPGCRACGETILAFLTLDHIHDNGSVERRNGLRGGSNLYSRLITQGFPDGFQCLCWNCNHLKEYHRVKSSPATAKAAYRHNYKKKLATDVFSAYGSRCSCCGLDDQRLLTVDHINGGGKQHLKALKANPAKFYCWLRTNKYPEGFRILCRNCNSGRSVNGGCCPHAPVSGQGPAVNQPPYRRSNSR